MEFSQVYDPLDDLSKEVLHFMALVHSRIEPRTLMTGIVQSWGGGTSHTRILQLEETIKDLKRSVFVSANNHIMWLVAFQNELLHKAVQDQDWSWQAFEAINKIYPATGHYYSNDPLRIVRHLRYSFYDGKPELYHQTIKQIFSRDDSYFNNIASDLPLAVITDQWLSNYGPAFTERFVVLRTSIIYKKLSPELGVFITLVEHIRQHFQKNNLLIGSLGTLYCLAGDYNKLRALMEVIPTVWEKYIFTAILLTMEGKNEAAAVQFDIAVKQFRKSNGMKTKYFSGHLLVFYILHGLRTQGALFAEDGLKIIAKSVDIGVHEDVLKVLCHHFLKNNEQSLYIYNRINVDENISYFWKTIATSWTGVVQKDDLPKLHEFYDACISKGHWWIAWEIAAIINKTLTATNETNGFFNHFKGDQGVSIPLCQVIQLVPTWEFALSKILKIAESAKPKGAIPKANDTRLVWYFRFEKGISIEPYEQTFGARGWTSGKAVALKRLLDGNVKCTTDQDRAIIQCIEMQNVSYGWQHKLQPMLNQNKALPQLVGHPLLFLTDSANTPLQLTEGKPSLHINETSNGFTINFEKYTYSNEKIGVLKETPTRYSVVQFDSQYQAIYETLLKDNPVFPKEAQSTLQVIAEKLSLFMDIQSPLMENSEVLPGVEADNRIYFHLLPQGTGFQVEAFVKPFRTVAPYFKPGKGKMSVTGSPNDIRSKTTRNPEVENAALEAAISRSLVLQEILLIEDIWTIGDTEQCLQLLVELDPLVKEEKVVIEWPKGEKFRIKKVAGIDDFFIKIKSQRDWFAIDGNIQIDESEVLTMQTLLSYLAQNETAFVPLSQGQYIALTNELRKRLLDMNGFVRHQKNSLGVHPLAVAGIDEILGNSKNISVDKKWKENISRFRTHKDKHYPIPAGLKADLRPYQAEGFQWLSRLSDWGAGACLADDMGLGKTIQALAILLQRATLGPALVVAPASVVRNWRIESDRFSPELKVAIYGENDRAAMIQQAEDHDIIVCTYNLLQRDAALFMEKNFATIILDEAQAIKNRTTKRSFTVMELKGDFKIITTGTPIENHLGELWNLFNFINPGLLGSYQDFNERFAVPIERNKDVLKREQLKKLIQPFVLRRLKKDVLKELPAKTEIVLNVELSAEERAFYEALRRKALEQLENSGESGGAKHLQILAEITKLRLACCHPQLITPEIPLESSKLSLFETVVDELLENKHKALVFSQFVKHLDIIRRLLDQKGITYQYLDGSTPLNTRQARIDAFQAGRGDIFLISLKAGGAGLNLTAADYVIHLDPWWNPAVEDQASDRAHRIGQTKPVTVYRLVSSNTIEDKILQLHEYKRDLADSLLSGTDVSARLSADELLELIKAV